MKKIYLIFIILFLLFLLLICSYSYANDELVYVDNNDIDTKYHRITCNHIFPNGYHSISVEEAFNIGYRRCPDCSPPMADVEYNERMEHAKEISNSVSKYSSSTSNSSSSEKTVYVGENDSKYHLYGCDELKGDPHKTTLSTAVDKGYAPCKVCNPYELASAEIAEEKAEKKEITTKIIIIIGICVLLLVAYVIFNEKRYKITRNK